MGNFTQIRISYIFHIEGLILTQMLWSLPFGNMLWAGGYHTGITTRAPGTPLALSLGLCKRPDAKNAVFHPSDLLAFIAVTPLLITFV